MSLSRSLFLAKFRASGLHLLGSVLVATLVAVVVFKLWFPYPFREVSGGTNLFLLIISVDVVLGPLLTLVAFNPAKTRGHLARDLATIAVLQLAGLAYGTTVMYSARPIGMVYEVDRFRAVTYADVKMDELPKALPELGKLSLTGPRLMGIRDSKPGAERLETLDLSMAGFEVSMRPSFWVPYQDSVAAVLKRARPAQLLLDHHADQRETLQKAVAETGQPVAALRFLPLQGRQDNWVVLLDAQTAQPLGYAKVDGFF
ncbi:MAG TPA: TfpX/TfpZ family type IV pilin accessory protein [Burkholderiaceae bacterium]|nr:TfpX/TfpZ family type IV pilin accessory protein [Burkholderiaceae bacterium]